MSAGNKAIKYTAKEALKNNMLASVFSVCILIFTAFLVYYISYLLSIVTGDIIANIFMLALTVFLTAPLLLGVFRYFWRLLFGAEDNPVAVFYYFSQKSQYIKALKLVFSLLIRAILPAVFIYFPAVAVYFISKGDIFELLGMSIPLWAAHLEYVYVFLHSLGNILLILVMLKFYLSPMLLVSDENMDVGEAINMSAVISRKTSVDFIYLFFSFIGWILLSLLVIPLVFTLPYFITSYAVHYRFAVADYNKHIEMSVNNDFPTFVTGI